MSMSKTIKINRRTFFGAAAALFPAVGAMAKAAGYDPIVSEIVIGFTGENADFTIRLHHSGRKSALFNGAPMSRSGEANHSAMFETYEFDSPGKAYAKMRFRWINEREIGLDWCCYFAPRDGIPSEQFEEGVAMLRSMRVETRPIRS